MRITESRIKQIIREEIESMMGPEEFDSRNPSHASAMRRHFKRLEKGEDEPEQRSSGLPRFPGDEDEQEDYLSKLRSDWDKLNRRARDLDEAISLEKSTSPREKLESYLMDNGGEELVDVVMSAIDSALERAMDSGERPDSENVTFNLSDEILDMIPDGDEDDWHEMLDAVLKDEFDPDAFEEAEADRESEEETRRDLSHSSRFLPSRGSRY